MNPQQQLNEQVIADQQQQQQLQYMQQQQQQAAQQAQQQQRSMNHEAAVVAKFPTRIVPSWSRQESIASASTASASSTYSSMSRTGLEYSESGMSIGSQRVSVTNIGSSTGASNVGAGGGGIYSTHLGSGTASPRSQSPSSQGVDAHMVNNPYLVSSSNSGLAPTQELLQQQQQYPQLSQNNVAALNTVNFVGDDDAALSRFTFKKVIGSGSSGTVIMVKEVEQGSVNSGSVTPPANPHTSNLFALKITSIKQPPEGERDKTMAENVEDEVVALNYCKASPFVQRLRCAFHEDVQTTITTTNKETGQATSSVAMVRNHALVTELVECGDLRKELKRRKMLGRPFRPEEAAALFAQILLGLAHVHEQEFIHRDIKAGNIFLKTNGTIKLGDFGYAKKRDSPLLINSFVGTPYYAAPEIWEQQRYDLRVDIYALGVVFYEMLMLQRPFSGENIRAVRQAALQAVYDPPTSYKELVALMLARNPAQRPTAHQLLQLVEVQNILRGLHSALEHSPLIPDVERGAIIGEVHKYVLPVTATNPNVTGPSSSVPQQQQHQVGAYQQQGHPQMANGMAAQQTAAAAAPAGGPPAEVIPILREGFVYKRSTGDGAYKKRFLRLTYRTPQSDAAGHIPELVLAQNQRHCTIPSKRIATPAESITNITIPVEQTTADVVSVVDSATNQSLPLLRFCVEATSFQPVYFGVLTQEDRSEWLQALSFYTNRHQSGGGNAAAVVPTSQ